MEKEILAIIIPAYKKNFLYETLVSIASQTNRDFHLYIGDDHSPFELYDIIKPFGSKIKLTYHRFTENLGSISLTKQWERCIALSDDEPYIWLFSDDDIMPHDAVQRFYETRERTNGKYPLYRFNLRKIDADGNQLSSYKEKPELETNREFIMQRFQGKYLSAACEYIFSRDIYEKHNGFVDFPKGWYSDDATWVKFSQHSHIYTISGEPVYWRESNINISSEQKNSNDFYTGFKQYLKWILNFFNPSIFETSFNKRMIYYCLLQSRYCKKSLSVQLVADLYSIYHMQYGYTFGLFFILIFKLIYIKYYIKRLILKVYHSIND